MSCFYLSDAHYALYIQHKMRIVLTLLLNTYSTIHCALCDYLSFIHSRVVF